MAEFVMPSLGADMEAGELAAWLRQEGDQVQRGDIIAEVETDKGIIEVEVFSSGVIEKLLVAPGTRVPVGTPLALIRGAEGPTSTAPKETKVEVAKPVPAAAAELVPSVPAPALKTVSASPSVAISYHAGSARQPDGQPRLHISPSARRLARELGVDLAGVKGTGPEGALCRDDIFRAAKRGAKPGAKPGEVTQAAKSNKASTPNGAAEQAAATAARARRAIAAAMTRSKREIPHYYVGHTLELGRMMKWLAERNETLPAAERLVPAVLFVKACALALRDFPALNARWENEAVVLSEHINVGPAISLRGGGLVAPAIIDTDKKDLRELTLHFRDLVSRARRGRLRSSEHSDATVTVTSLGDRGVDTVIGVIYPPQVAIIGFGKVVERPWVVDGCIGPRPVVNVSLSGDHRASDGHTGALFLNRLEQLLQAPETL